MSSPPRAFRLSEPNAASAADLTPKQNFTVAEEPLEAIEAADGVPVVVERRRAPLLAILVSSLVGLASLGIGLAIERLIADLLAATPWLGWTALVLAALAALAFVGLVSRELRGVWRERRIERLRQQAADTLATRDHEAARRIVREIADMYAGRPRLTPGPTVADVDGEIMDADDRLALAERTLIVPLDGEAQRAIASAAKRVSVVTAVSPRALIDVAFVIYAGAGLLRQIARIYGGRPGFFGSVRLARAAVNHLAVTGGVAVGDSILHGVLGVGLAARVSAKLGEGMLNGLMTARFGLSALEVCRPLPFIRETPPRLADVAGELLSSTKSPTSA